VIYDNTISYFTIFEGQTARDQSVQFSDVILCISVSPIVVVVAFNDKLTLLSLSTLTELSSIDSGPFLDIALFESCFFCLSTSSLSIYTQNLDLISSLEIKGNSYQIISDDSSVILNGYNPVLFSNNRLYPINTTRVEKGCIINENFVFNNDSSIFFFRIEKVDIHFQNKRAKELPIVRIQAISTDSFIYDRSDNSLLSIFLDKRFIFSVPSTAILLDFFYQSCKLVVITSCQIFAFNIGISKIFPVNVPIQPSFVVKTFNRFSKFFVFNNEKRVEFFSFSFHHSSILLCLHHVLTPDSEIQAVTCNASLFALGLLSNTVMVYSIGNCNHITLLSFISGSNSDTLFDNFTSFRLLLYEVR
jgi:hypothetical protein